MAVKQVFNTSAELDFPNVLPTLDLDFANSKTLDPRITFTRSSGGSYVGADGLIKYAGVNEARFDHDPVTGESLGLLVEEARTNLLTRSEKFDIWNKFDVSVLLNSGSSPDGNFNAIQIIEDATTSTHYVVRTTGTITSGLPYTASCFAKSTNPNRFFSLIFEGAALLFEGVNPRASFDLTSGKINTITAATSAKIENYGNGWYRCSVTATPSATGSSAIQLRLQTNVTANSMIGSYTGDGVSGLYLWGAQVEQGAFPTSYIPTLGSTRTRAADNASITGKNFSEWYRQDSEGTIYVNCKVNSREYSNQTPLRIHYGVNLRGIGPNLDTRASTSYPATFVTRTDGGASFVSSNTFYTIQDNIKLAGTYGKNEIAAAFNGLVRSSPQSFVFIPMTRMDIGARIPVSGSLFFYNGTIRRIVYFPKRLPNSQLISLTT
jgi:hypothetical protein